MRREPSIQAQVREKHQAVVALLDSFCLECLNDEYRILCHRLLGVLARKRPSPLVNGAAQTWACVIVRTIGWVNFLDDRTQTPHVKMVQIDKAFGVSSGTGQARSKAVRDLLRIRMFDVRWTLPSRMERNPMVWLVQLGNGLVVDARMLPREAQVEAFERGMVPYIAADRENAREVENGKS